MRGYKKFKNIVAVLYLTTAILFVLLNIYVLRLADNFAEKHGADGYEIGFRELVISPGGIPEINHGNDTTVHSYFTFYSSDNLKLMYDKEFNDAYNEFNIKVQSLYDGFKLLIIFVFGFSLVGTSFSSLRRNHFYGYILATILTVLIFIGVSWVNTFAYITSGLLLVSAYLVYKSRFVGYNESFLSLDWLKLWSKKKSDNIVG